MKFKKPVHEPFNERKKGNVQNIILNYYNLNNNFLILNGGGGGVNWSLKKNQKNLN